MTRIFVSCDLVYDFVLSLRVNSKQSRVLLRDKETFLWIVPLQLESLENTSSYSLTKPHEE